MKRNKISYRIKGGPCKSGYELITCDGESSVYTTAEGGAPVPFAEVVPCSTCPKEVAVVNAAEASAGGPTTNNCNGDIASLVTDPCLLDVAGQILAAIPDGATDYTPLLESIHAATVAVKTAIDNKPAPTDYTALLNDIKLALSNVDSNTDNLAAIHNAIQNLSTLVSDTNAILSDDVVASLTAILDAAHITNANTDQLEALLSDSILGLTEIDNNTDQVEPLLTDIKAKLIDMEVQLATANNYHSNNSTELGAIKNALDTTNTGIAASNIKLDTIDSSIDVVSATVDTVKTSVDAVNTTVGTVKTSVDAVNTSIGTTNGKLDTVKTSVDAVNTTVGTVKTSVDAVKAAVDTSNTALSTLVTDDTVALFNKVVRASTFTAPYIGSDLAAAETLLQLSITFYEDGAIDTGAGAVNVKSGTTITFDSNKLNPVYGTTTAVNIVTTGDALIHYTYKL